MISAIDFVIVTAALIYILVESTIGAVWRFTIRYVARRNCTLRDWITALIYCPACTGFWVGFGLYWVGWADWAESAPRPEVLSGCAGLVIGLLLPRVTSFGTSYDIEIAERDNESTQARESSHD